MANLQIKTDMTLFDDPEGIELPNGPELSEEIRLGGTTQSTAKIAAEYLVSLGQGFIVPTATQRKLMLVAFAEKGFTLYGKAFDMFRVRPGLILNSLNNIDDFRNSLHQIMIYEIKSTNKKAVKENFDGYFFSISTAELLTAQSLGDRYKFAFVNTVTKKHLELSL